MNHLKIAYSCNDGYIEQTGISLISLFENNKEFDYITLYLISKDVSESNIKIVKDICIQYGRNINIIEFKDIAYDLNISSTGRHIETIYTKIFFSRIEGLDKVLYIDSDTIIRDSLKRLWETELRGYYMGMVETYTGDQAREKLGMKKYTSFFNDGVALCNVKYCRDYDLIGQCLNLIDYFDGNPPVLSEGVLNKVCEDRILSLSPRYNMMAGLYQLASLNPKYVAEKLDYTLEDIKESYKNPVIIHFLSGFYNRPWNLTCSHPLKGEFFKYKNMSPWKEEPLMDSKLSGKIRFLGWLLDCIGPYNFEKIRNLIK